MAGTTLRDEELEIETITRGPQWHTVSTDFTTFLETGDKMIKSVEALDLGAGCFVRFPTVHIPGKPSEFERVRNDKGEKTWIPDVHLEQTEDGWILAPGAAQERGR